MYYLSVLARMEYEERVKSFEGKHQGEPVGPPGLRQMCYRAAWLFHRLKYRLSAVRKPAAPTEDPCLEMQAVGQNGC